MSGKKSGCLIFVGVLLLALIGIVVYFIVTKKYYPKVKGVEYINLELAQDTAQAKIGVDILNRIPLPISLDSIFYTYKDQKDTLGWGQMTTEHTLPILGSQVVDFKMLLDFKKYRDHIKQQQEKDSINIDVALNIFFDLPIISPESITVNRQFKVPVAKSPKMEVRDIKVRGFSVEEGYSLLLRIDATNKNLPGLEIENFRYNVRLGDTLNINGFIDSTFAVGKGEKLLEIPLELSTSDAISLIKKKLSGDTNWKYDATLEAQINSQNPIFDSFSLQIEKTGELDIGSMGGDKNYLPSIKQVKRLDVYSDEEKTRINANVVVHNPSPFPFYIDSASYFVRHKGKVIARGKRNIEKVLPKQGDQALTLELIVDERAYQNLMKQAQGQDKIPLEIELNLIYNLPSTSKTQRISLKRQIQVPVPGQAGIQVTGLEVRELDPAKGAYLGLKLKVESSNLPDLQIRQLDYRLQLSDGILLQGQTKDPIKITGASEEIEVPIRLSAEDVKQLVRKAIQGSTDWKYDLKAMAHITSSNKILGSTKINLEFTGVLEMAKGMGGKKLTPHITKIDSIGVTIHYDTAWVDLNVQVKNPLPVQIHVDSLAIKITHSDSVIALGRNEVNKILPPEGTQSGWIQIKVNYGLWRSLLKANQEKDSISIKEEFMLAFSIGDLGQQRVPFSNQVNLPTPKAPVTELQKLKLRGFGFRKGIVFNALVQVQNANSKGLEVSDITYNLCAENLLDACGTINRTYDIPLGQSIVKVPISLSIGEVFRAFFAKLFSGKKERNLYLDGSATVNTANPIIQNTNVKFEKWEKTKMFGRKKAQSSK